VGDEEPVERAEKCLEGAEELEEGDLRKASEKLWGACALMANAHALAKRGVRIESHRDL